MGGKTAGNASLQSGPSITHPVHVATHNDGFIRLYIHRPAGPSERLLAGMTMEKHPPVDELSAGDTTSHQSAYRSHPVSGLRTVTEKR